MSARITRLPAPARERAVIYLRQSTYREESISLEVQEQAARQHAERQGYDVVGVESDPGVTGRSWKRRAGVQAAIGALEAGTAEVVVVWRWSRLSRSRRDWAVAADMADVAGGRIESATEPNDRTAAGRFARGVMTELAAFESERIGEQWAEARAHRVARGLPSTGGQRFGYRIVDRAYVIDPVTGPIYAELYRVYLAGAGSAQLARLLDERGIRRGRANDQPWTYQTVLSLLDTGFAAGLLVKTPPRPKDNPYAAAPKLPVWEREFRPGAHEPIIDRATWDAFVAARRARTVQRVRTGSPMLSGLLVCTDCGGPMHGNRSKGKPIYVCSRGSRIASVKAMTIAAAGIEADVEAWVLQLADELTARKAAQTKTVERAERVELTGRRAQQQLERIEARLVSLTLKFADDAIPAEVYRQTVAQLEAERADAERRLQSATPNPVRDAAPAALSPDLRRQWPHMTPDVRNAILRPLIARVEVRPAAHRGERGRRWRIVASWDDE